jgi:hypothetical protein
MRIFCTWPFTTWWAVPDIQDQISCLLALIFLSPTTPRGPTWVRLTLSRQLMLHSTVSATHNVSCSPALRVCTPRLQVRLKSTLGTDTRSFL